MQKNDIKYVYVHISNLFKRYLTKFRVCNCVRYIVEVANGKRYPKIRLNFSLINSYISSLIE